MNHPTDRVVHTVMEHCMVKLLTVFMRIYVDFYKSNSQDFCDTKHTFSKKIINIGIILKTSKCQSLDSNLLHQLAWQLTVHK